MHELNILQDQFADTAKRYPGLECCVIGWHRSYRETEERGSEDATDCPITLPPEYRCSASDCICAWEHFPCQARHLISDSHREYLSESDLAAYEAECEERVSWRKKTLLMRRTGETWKKETAFASLATLTDRTMPYVRRWNALSHSAYFDVESELEVYAEGTWSDQEEYNRDPRVWDLVRWLWLLFLVNTNQRVCIPYAGAGGCGSYPALPSYRERHWPYAMKIDDVFLESAFLCRFLLKAHTDHGTTGPMPGSTITVRTAPSPRSPEASMHAVSERIQPLAGDAENGPAKGVVDALIRVREAARMLGVHAGTISRMVADGRLRSNGRKGKGRRIWKSSILLLKDKREEMDRINDAAEVLHDMTNRIPDKH